MKQSRAMWIDAEVCLNEDIMQQVQWIMYGITSDVDKKLILFHLSMIDGGKMAGHVLKHQSWPFRSQKWQNVGINFSNLYDHLNKI